MCDYVPIQAARPEHVGAKTARWREWMDRHRPVLRRLPWLNWVIFDDQNKLERDGRYFTGD